jgi:hypothetical protein
MGTAAKPQAERNEMARSDPVKFILKIPTECDWIMKHPQDMSSGIMTTMDAMLVDLRFQIPRNRSSFRRPP